MLPRPPSQGSLGTFLLHFRAIKYILLHILEKSFWSRYAGAAGPHPCGGAECPSGAQIEHFGRNLGGWCPDMAAAE